MGGVLRQILVKGDASPVVDAGGYLAFLGIFPKIQRHLFAGDVLQDAIQHDAFNDVYLGAPFDAFKLFFEYV